MQQCIFWSEKSMHSHKSDNVAKVIIAKSLKIAEIQLTTELAGLVRLAPPLCFQKMGGM